MTAELVLASGNHNKLLEMSDALRSYGIRVLPVEDFGELPEIAEVGTTLAENAAIKATSIARHLQRWTLGDDTGLFVHALKGAPGVQSARFAGPQATAAENRGKLLRELDGVRDQQRGAYFECCLVVADPAGNVRLTLTGRCDGIIVTEPRGNSGFGYDSLFFVPEQGRTFAELSSEMKSMMSHRGRAAQQLGPKVVRLLGMVT
jgi:XTP/dITP diphosphohydrolase